MRDSVSNPLLRLRVDPNTVSRAHPQWSPVLLDESMGLAVGDWVWAVQDSDDEPDYVGLAQVALVDAGNGLLFLAVDWNSFGEDRSPARDSTPKVRVAFKRGAEVIQLPSTGAPRRVFARIA